MYSVYRCRIGLVSRHQKNLKSKWQSNLYLDLELNYFICFKFIKIKKRIASSFVAHHTCFQYSYLISSLKFKKIAISTNLQYWAKI